MDDIGGCVVKAHLSRRRREPSHRAASMQYKIISPIQPSGKSVDGNVCIHVEPSAWQRPVGCCRPTVKRSHGDRTLAVVVYYRIEAKNEKRQARMYRDRVCLFIEYVISRGFAGVDSNRNARSAR